VRLIASVGVRSLSIPSQSRYPGAGVGLVLQVSVTQEKLLATLVEPLPLYCGTCGNGQIGRCMTMPSSGTSLLYLVATSEFGATPFSTHCWSASKASCVASSTGGGAA